MRIWVWVDEAGRVAEYGWGETAEDSRTRNGYPAGWTAFDPKWGRKPPYPWSEAAVVEGAIMHDAARIDVLTAPGAMEQARREWKSAKEEALRAQQCIDDLDPRDPDELDEIEAQEQIRQAALARAAEAKARVKALRQAL